MSTTLICYDGSASARHAIELAGRSLASSRALLLNVWSPPERVHADSFSFEQSSSRHDGDLLTRQSERRAQEILAEGHALAERHGIDAETRAEAVRSSVWETIVQVADEIDCDIILMGTHGGTAVEPRLLGSESQALVNHSRRPVLIVPLPHSPAHGATAPGTAEPEPSRAA